MVSVAVENPSDHATTFGYAGTYWDYVQEIVAERGDISRLVNLDISESDVAAILREAGATGYRYDGALRWIIKAMEMIRLF